MRRRNGLMMFAVGVVLVAATAACGRVSESSITGPSAVAPETLASSGSGDSGSGGGGDDTIRVRCERRANRSKASVDGNNLPSGTYRARLTSGANVATSQPRNTVGDEVEFDFDSNRNDIAAGATPIARDFIQGLRAQGELLNSAGQVVASATVQCRAN